uniref:Uncharacterized protein n=1 Tax=Cucumis melo TaxID=3656 RepID=A0A9I9D343_CUCME
MGRDLELKEPSKEVLGLIINQKNYLESRVKNTEKRMAGISKSFRTNYKVIRFGSAVEGDGGFGEGIFS